MEVDIMRRTGGPAACAVLIPLLFLAGCYEKGDGLASQALFSEPQQVHGAAALPSEGGPYTLITPAGEFGVTADGTYEARIPADLPCLSVLLDEQGQVVWFGFLRPGDTPQMLNADTTAVALLYFALGGFTLPGSDLAAFLDLLENAPSALQVATILRLDPQALANGDPELLAALDAARAELLGGGTLTAEALRPAGRRSLQEAAITPGRIQLAPDGQQSFIEMMTQPGGKVFALNHVPRRGVLLAYRTGLTGLDGVTRAVDPPVFMGEAPLPVTSQLKHGIARVDELLVADDPWNPRPSEGIELPLDLDSGSVQYELVVLGASFGTGGPILSDPRFDTVHADWTERLGRLQRETFVADFLVPVLASLAFGSDYMMQGVPGADAIATLSDLVGPTLEPFALDSPGGFRGGMGAVVEAAAADPALGEALLHAIAGLLTFAKPDGKVVHLFDFSHGPHPGTKAIGNALRVLQALASAQTVLDAIDRSLDGTDASGRMQVLSDARPAESWQASVGRVSLEPENPVVTVSAPVVTLDARVVIEGLDHPSFRYHWHTSGVNGSLEAVDGDGTDFETAEASVDYVADVGSIVTGEVDTVTVEVLLDGVAIGEATVAIQGDRGLVSPCSDFPWGDYESPFNTVSVSPDIVRTGDFVTVSFTYDHGNPDAGMDGLQGYKVWIPYADTGSDILVDGVPLRIEPPATSDQVQFPPGGWAEIRVLDTHNDLLFETFYLVGPETLVGYRTGTLVVEIIPPDAGPEPGWQGPSGPDTHTIQFHVGGVFGSGPLCPFQGKTPLGPGNLYWLGPLVTVDWGDNHQYWSPDLPEAHRSRTAGAALAPFEILRDG